MQGGSAALTGRAAALAHLPGIPVQQQGKPVVLSTGMADWATVDEVVTRALAAVPHPQLVLLQCTSSYPSNACDINLKVMDTYRRAFPRVVVGYSGHERGIALTTCAVAMGASLVERHVTLDRTQPGGDHAASLEPAGFRKLVRDIRELEVAQGDGVKRMWPAEVPVLRKLGKSLCTTQALPAGTVLCAHHLVAKTDTVAGLSPLHLAAVLGRAVRHALDVDRAVTEDDLEPETTPPPATPCRQ